MKNLKNWLNRNNFNFEVQKSVVGKELIFINIQGIGSENVKKIKSYLKRYKFNFEYRCNYNYIMANKEEIKADTEQEKEVEKMNTKKELRPIYNEDIKGHKEYIFEQLEKYNSGDLNFTHKRINNKMIEEYTKYFVYKDNTFMAVKPSESGYPSGYYDHVKQYNYRVDHINKIILFTDTEVEPMEEGKKIDNNINIEEYANNLVESLPIEKNRSATVYLDYAKENGIKTNDKNNIGRKVLQVHLMKYGVSNAWYKAAEKKGVNTKEELAKVYFDELVKMLKEQTKGIEEIKNKTVKQSKVNGALKRYDLGIKRSLNFYNSIDEQIEKYKNNNSYLYNYYFDKKEEYKKDLEKSKEAKENFINNILPKYTIIEDVEPIKEEFYNIDTVDLIEEKKENNNYITLTEEQKKERKHLINLWSTKTPNDKQQGKESFLNLLFKYQEQKKTKEEFKKHINKLYAANKNIKAANAGKKDFNNYLVDILATEDILQKNDIIKNEFFTNSYNYIKCI